MKLDFGKRSVPLVIAILFFVGFALMIPWLGFYLGDWEVILAAKSAETLHLATNIEKSLGLGNIFLPIVSLLGAKPLLWQILSLVARYLTVLVTWWCLLRLWPGRFKEVTWIALLFTVYPVFSGQQIALVSIQYWIGIALFILSLGTMIKSLQTLRFRWSFFLISLVSAFLYPFFINDFIGLEILRLLMLWFISLEQQTVKKRLSFSLLNWLPFLFVAILSGFGKETLNQGYFAGLYPTINSVNISFLGSLQSFIRGSIDLILTPWYSTVEPASINLSDRFWLLSWLIAIVVAALIGIYSLHLHDDVSKKETISGDVFFRQSICLGLVSFFVGILPVALHNTSLVRPFFQSPASILPMFGASLLAVSATSKFIESESRKVVVLSILLGLAISFQIRTANDFRWQWVGQARFYWQLYWRAPMISPDALVTSDSAFFAANGGDIPVSAGLGLLYSGTNDQVSPYRFQQLNADNPIIDPRALSSPNQPGNVLVLTYEPENGNCLWLLSPDDRERPQVSKTLREIVGFINLDQVVTESQREQRPPGSIFGKEPEHGWCYFYQKAELALQDGDYQRIVELGNQVRKAGFEPNNVQEWLPFIMGYAHTGRWEKAREITQLVYKSQPVFDEWLCNAWKNILAEGQPVTGEIQVIDQMLSELQCEIGQ